MNTNGNSYSQNNEDVIVRQYFKDSLGTFLDIGANDGKTLSNTFALANMGWFGVCVEPDNRAFQILLNLYSHSDNIECFHFAISDHIGLDKFYTSGEHLGTGDVALLSTLHENELKRWEGSNNKFTETVVKVITFKTILEMSEHKHFDFISIDAEGNDMLILKQINLSELGCECLCIEHNGNQQVLNDIIIYCRSYGLTKELLRNAENIILAK